MVPWCRRHGGGWLAGARGAGPADKIGSPSTSVITDTSRFPPSAGPGHRLRVQGAGREFAGHQDAILEKVGPEADLRDRVPVRLPRHCRARGVAVAHVASAGSGHG